MKAESMRIQISPYGRASSLLESLVQQGLVERRSVAPPVTGRMATARGRGLHLWVAYSPEVDETFVKSFRQLSTPRTRLLVMNDVSERPSADSLFTHLMGMQIRSPQRFYVMDGSGTGKTCSVALLLQRLASALASKDNNDRILDARIETGVLRVVSPEFKRLDIPVSQIPALVGADPVSLAEFEIDEDGSFIYWPKLDAHLGWEQLFQIVNPDAARKAHQKKQHFNTRYGKAVRKVREMAVLKPADIEGLSEKQLGRVEKGECRLTSNAIKLLSNAHKLTPSEYLERLAKALG